MIKKKGVYIEKMSFGYGFSILYYDGKYLLIIPINSTKEPSLFIKYSGTTFIDVYTKERTTISKVLDELFILEMSWVCKDYKDFPILDIECILNSMLKEGKYYEYTTNN